uniref:Transcription initiation factor TFIID subunit 10 n=1 Tax=Chlamydomonas euryale TaxID=1486919 RepID=A0A7R9VN70_9CHLO|mmetsp:Transcript_39606/g.117839  ORF Transcript_39606/g.117839 Transcript_39606/m.117839 type:complete len:127 (+) Transcript_39606:145-525(+)
MSFAGRTTVPDGTGELLERLDEQSQLVPDELAQYMLRKNGQDPADPRITRLVSLAAQRFIAEVVHDSLQICKARLGAMTKTKLRQAGYKDRRILVTDDLAKALQEMGVNVSKPPYYVDTAADAAKK